MLDSWPRRTEYGSNSTVETLLCHLPIHFSIITSYWFNPGKYPDMNWNLNEKLVDWYVKHELKHNKLGPTKSVYFLSLLFNHTHTTELFVRNIGVRQNTKLKCEQQWNGPAYIHMQTDLNILSKIDIYTCYIQIFWMKCASVIAKFFVLHMSMRNRVLNGYTVFLYLTRVKSGNFGHQVNSDIHLKTVEIQMRRVFYEPSRLDYYSLLS